MKKIIAQYQTIQLPPPYSFDYQLIISPKADGLEVDFKLHYTDRDELSEEEILDEGFTMMMTTPGGACCRLSGQKS